MKPIQHLCVLSFVCAGLAAACGQPAGGQNRRGAGPAVAIQTTTPQRMAVQRQVDLSGTLLSPDEAKVSAEVGRRGPRGPRRNRPGGAHRRSAGQDRAARARPGARTGRERAAPDSRAARHARAGDRRRRSAPRRRDRVGPERAARASTTPGPTAERAKTLAGRGLISPVDLQTAETRLKVAEATYQSAVDTVRGQKALLQDRRAAYDLAVKKLGDAVVRAPISGVVAGPTRTGRRVHQRADGRGDNRPGATRSSSARACRSATPASFTPARRWNSGWSRSATRCFTGKVAFVSPSLDQTMRTFTVEALVDNTDRRLKPGFFAKGDRSSRAATKACSRCPTARSRRWRASRRSTS